MTGRRGVILLLALSLMGCANDRPLREQSASTRPPSAPTTTTASPSTTTTALPAPETSTTIAPGTTVEPGPIAAPSPLAPGADGDEVRKVQLRLEDLGYWIGAPDGAFGELTKQGVYAFQKVQGLQVDGRVGPETVAALAAPVPFGPQSQTGTAWEIDKTRQVLVLVRGGDPIWIWNTSTGTELPYVHDGRHLLADTPVGNYHVTWEVDGWRNGTLGPIYRPKYFHPDGLAIHGYPRVPPAPASHGCVRVTLAAMDFIWSTGDAPKGATIRVYGETPA